jgi:hypothetical protein
MTKKIKIIFITGFLGFTFAGAVFANKIYNFLPTIDIFGTASVLRRELEHPESPIVITACPTFYYMLEKIENEENIKIIKSQTTTESLYLLEKEEVDLVISGRALKQNEFNFLSKKIGHGYDFVSEKEMYIVENQMKDFIFYTNLNFEKIIEDFNFISENNLTKTENPFEYLNRGIAIISLENNLEGELVHILKNDGSRIRISRIPRLYYKDNIPEEKINFIEEIIKEN